MGCWKHFLQHLQTKVSNLNFDYPNKGSGGGCEGAMIGVGGLQFYYSKNSIDRIIALPPGNLMLHLLLKSMGLPMEFIWKEFDTRLCEL